MKKYTQLAEQERYHIYLMKKQGFSLRFIAITINRSVSTISREISRNTGLKGCRPKQANRFSQARDINKSTNTSN
jgi:transposase, IS30 family